MKVLLTGAGGPAAIGVARSLRLAGHQIVGVDSNPYSLPFADADARYSVPRADHPEYVRALNHIIEQEKVDFLHAQPDAEVRVISEYRHQIKARTMLPPHETVLICQDKLLMNRRLMGTGVPIPRTIRIDTYEGLLEAERIHGLPFWIRNTTGAAGRGAMKVESPVAAWSWMHTQGGDFIASEYLPGACVTWQSVWRDGQLVCAQSRERIEWAMANRSPSGVTGVTGVARTISRGDVAEIGEACVRELDRRPHGIYGVDMKEDAGGTPRVTEVNIGRFFTTIEFFTRAGLNMPDLYLRAAFGKRTFSPSCEDDLYWIRSMDAEPKLLRGTDL